jgi:hypothetical protein
VAYDPGQNRFQAMAVHPRMELPLAPPRWPCECPLATHFGG